MRGRVVAATAAVAGIAATSVLTGLVVAPAQAEDATCTNITDPTDISDDAEAASLPLDLLGVRRAQQVVKRLAPGGHPPVRVAVLDSGVIGDLGVNDQLTVHDRTTDITGHSAVSYYHGTAVAGLIAGHARPDGKPVGIAPAAEIVDVRVYDEAEADDGAKVVTGPAIVAGLTWVATHAKDLNIKVANISLAVGPTEGLSAAVKAARAAGVVVVASSGNRPEEGEPFDGLFADADDPVGQRDEDAATHLFPAGYPDVITVNATADGVEGADAIQYVLKNSRTDVAVPTIGGVSYGINGKACVLDSVATSWAAAEVSGVLALLWQRYPRETDEQIIARLLNTANGTMDDPTPMSGVGIVQPYAALTRPLDPSDEGVVQQATTQEQPVVPATAPEPEVDLLATTRDNAVWWGLIGGGTLVVALLLRPVLSRRRS